MVAHTVLLDFTVSSNVIVDVDKCSNLKLAIANVLQEHFDGLKPLTESSIDGSFLVLYTGPKGSLITVRGYTEGLITINIEYYKRDEEEALLDFEVELFTLITSPIILQYLDANFTIFCCFMDYQIQIIGFCIYRIWGHYKVHLVTYELIIYGRNDSIKHHFKSNNEKMFKSIEMVHLRKHIHENFVYLVQW